MNSEGSPSTPATDSHEPAAPPTDPAASAPASPGYYNQLQTQELEHSRSLKTQCEKPAHQEALAKEGITPETLQLFGAVVEEAGQRQVQTAASRDDKKADTSAAGKARRALIALCKDVQSAARQHSRLCRAAGLPFSLDGYLIGQNLALSRPLLLVNAEGLKTKAEKDALPGYDATKLAAIATAKAAFEATKDEQGEGTADASLATIGRNALMARLHDLRMAILHAFDRIFPHEIETNVPTRRLLGLHPHRRMKD